MQVSTISVGMFANGKTAALVLARRSRAASVVGHSSLATSLAAMTTAVSAFSLATTSGSVAAPHEQRQPFEGWELGSLVSLESIPGQGEPAKFPPGDGPGTLVGKCFDQVTCFF